MQHKSVFMPVLVALLLLLASPPASASASASASAGEADALDAVQVLRQGGCGGHVPAARPLYRDAALDRAAALWAGGAPLAAAAHANGYAASLLSGVHVTGADSTLVELMRRTHCRTVADRGLHDVGVHRQGLETWLIFAARDPSSPVASDTSLAAHALALVNEVRARGTRCGARTFGPAPPMSLSDTLNGVALSHAADMARHEYFEHEDLSGHSPADRVRAVGYPEKLVGENIAYGPQSADEVVKGWLDSPGHCENIMDPRFAKMGIAYSAGHATRRGLYWVQLLVAPKA